MKIALSRKGNCFFPAWNKDSEVMPKIPENEPIEYSYRRDRFLPLHRKLWAIMTVTAKNSNGKWNSPEEVLLALKYALGYVSTIKDVNGNDIVIPHSISFAKMGETKFETFYKLALPLCAREIGVEVEQLENNYQGEM